jgi:hypothetical protein
LYNPYNKNAIPNGDSNTSKELVIEMNITTNEITAAIPIKPSIIWNIDLIMDNAIIKSNNPIISSNSKVVIYPCSSF